MSHLSPLGDNAGAEVFIVNDGSHNATVLEDSPHGQTANLFEAWDALDDADHGLVVAERVAIDAHEAELLGELDHEVHAEGAQPAASLVLLDHDERIGGEAASRVLADGQNEGGDHLSGALVHDGELVAVLNLLAELFLVHVLVGAEALALLRGVHHEEVSLVQLRLCHGVHQDMAAVHQSGAEWHHLG